MLDKVIKRVQDRRNSAKDRRDSNSYQKLEESGVERISDADLKKYTGKTREELNEWAKNRSGVAGNQGGGDMATGKATGSRGYQSSKGYGGWGGWS